MLVTFFKVSARVKLLTWLPFYVMQIIKIILFI